MQAAEQLRYLILAAQREGNRMLGQRLRPVGLTPSQAEALRVLVDRQPLTLTGLGKLLVCETGTNPSRLVDRLIGMGLVERRQGTVDQRQVELTATEEGMRRARDVRKVEEALYAQIDSAIAGPDVAPALAVLSRIVAGFPSGRAVALRGLATAMPEGHLDRA